MASFNAAQAHQTPFIGALNPNYQADIVVLDDPYDVKIHQVIKKGHLISNHDFYTQPLSFAKNTMNFSLSPADLQLPLNSTTANIIQVIPNHIETEHLIEPVSIHNGNFCPDPSNDQLKMVVVERHHHTGKIGKAIVKGFNLTHGASHPQSHTTPTISLPLEQMTRIYLLPFSIFKKLAAESPSLQITMNWQPCRFKSAG